MDGGRPVADVARSKKACLYSSPSGGRMNEAEDHFLKALHTWVWSGFYDRQDVIDMVDRDLETGIDRDAIVAAVRGEFRKKAVAEASWPDVTDPDRLSAAFEVLRSQGVCALQNAGFTQSDGFQNVRLANETSGGKYRGYCFFHGQDLQRAMADQGLFLAFGLIETGGGDVGIGETVRRALTDQSLSVEWDGTTKTRILIPKIDWKRRFS